MDRVWRRIEQGEPDACWPWTGQIGTHGYGLVKYQGKQINAHRLVYFLVHGAWPVVARHACDNRLCCNPAHILDGSHADNAADRSRAGSETGSKNGRAKLVEEDIPAIRWMLKNGATKRAIGKRYGVSDVTIGFIASGKRWGHVP